LSAIRLQQVSKAWAEVHAVTDVSFTAQAGQFVTLLGPSGCGKSTTLRLIAGLETPTAGSIHLFDRDVTHQSPAHRHLSMVFQSYALFPHLDVAQNILFGLKVRGVGAAECAQRLQRTADLLGLGALLHRKPAQLSGGQQQRVALGRAIIAETPVCLMDEPLSNLDAQLRQEMRQELRALQRQLGITMVYVTHDQTEAMSMADQVILMHAGRIEQNATPAELYAQPATVFAARFIGTPPMNVVALAEHAPAGVLLGVRPEAIRLASDTGHAAQVLAVEYLGADSLLTCRIGAAQLNARVPGHHADAVGATVRLVWHAKDEHFFDAASGHRLTHPPRQPVEMVR